MSGYLRESRRWETAVLLTAPLLVLYELGLLLFSDGSVRNAADVILTRYLLRLDGRHAALIMNACVLMLFLVAAMRRERRATPGLLLLVMAESAVWALLLPFLGFLVDSLEALQAGGATEVLADLALGVGAGLYEELLFRLILVSVLYLVLHRAFRFNELWSTATSVLVAAAIFSWFHHWGALGEPWDAWRFVFRFLAGVVLGLLFVHRGLAVVCWTHALYNAQLLLR
ncbi:MAG: hypothetical protein CMJ90_08030 [Planctomycetes bacterium]|nr:hypothetical protein [Planctomycetota bacterium]